MKEIFGSRDGSMVGHYQSILEEASIPCFIRNEHAAALSELQGPAFYPVLCVDDEFYDAAMALLQPYYVAGSSKEPASDWTCPQCGEIVPGSFDSCWNCQYDKSEPAPVV
jgi:hypothetical protein